MALLVIPSLPGASLPVRRALALSYREGASRVGGRGTGGFWEGLADKEGVFFFLTLNKTLNKNVIELQIDFWGLGTDFFKILVPKWRPKTPSRSIFFRKSSFIDF